MRPKISMREALADPLIFGQIMPGASWYGWRVLLIASAGEELTDDEREEFRRLTLREREPGRLCRELIVIAGRRAGKSTAMAVFAIWLACLCDHRGVLAPGEIGVVTAGLARPARQPHAGRPNRKHHAGERAARFDDL